MLSDPNKTFLFLILLFLPTQLGFHFWPPFSYVNGIRIDYLSPTLYFSDVLIIVFISLSIKNIRLDLLRVKLSKKGRTIIALTLLSVFGSVIFSQVPMLSFIKTIKIVEYSFFGFALYANRQLLLKLLPKILPITIIFEVLLAFAQFFNKGSINGVFYFLGERAFTSQTPNIANVNILGELILRPYGTFPHPNVLGGFILISVAIIIFSKSFEKNMLSKAGVIIGALGIFISMSRISIVLFMILVLVFFAKRKTFVSYLLISISLGFLFLTPIRERFVVNLNEESLVVREQLINSSLSMIKNSPLFGVGLNNFLPSLPRFYEVSDIVYYIQPVHNILLLVFSEIGIIGGTLILYLLALVFIRSRFESKVLLFLVFGISMFDHYFLTIQQGQLLLTLVLVLSLINQEPKMKS